MAFLSGKKPKKSLKGTNGTLHLSTKRVPKNGVIDEEEEIEDDMLNQEFYPELLALIINFLTSHKSAFVKGNKEVLDTFTDIASQATFHISKECALQFLLEDAGIYADRSHVDFEEAFNFLQVVLNGLYWEHMNQCLPLQARRKNFGGEGEDEGELRVEDIANVIKQVENHPNLFHDQVAMYSYLPNILLNNLWAECTNRGDGISTSSLHFEGVCMLADISGFTKLSGMCCEEGTGGLDRLHSACSGYLGKFVQTVYSFRGDVISFAGDAIIVIFPLDPLDTDANFTSESEAKEFSRMVCCQRAVECGKILAGFYTNELTAHVGISYGEMSIAKLGGYNSQWVYLMNGACINEISSCVDNATSKQVVVTRTLFDNLFMTAGESGKYRKERDFQHDLGGQCFEMSAGSRRVNIAAYELTSGNMRIDDFVVAVGDRDALEVPLVSRFHSYSTPDLRLQCCSEAVAALMPPPAPTPAPTDGAQEIVFDETVKLFVPKPVLDAISFSTLETVSELREVTTMFLNLNSYDPEINRDPTTLQDFAIMAQQMLAKTGGFMRQFLIDDKGCVLIAMWGVPSFSYSNNMERATACSILLRSGTLELGHKCSIGITSGTVYVGNIGSLVRRDFVGLGADVNLAARFMSKAKGSIYIDQKAAAQLPAQFRDGMALSPGLVLKGVKGLSHAFVCTGDLSDFVYSDFVEDVCRRKVEQGADADANSKVLLPKSISDPIKSRLRKNQRRQAFLAKQIEPVDFSPGSPGAEPSSSLSHAHAPTLGMMKKARSKQGSITTAMMLSKRGVFASSRGFVQRGSSKVGLTPQQAAKSRAAEGLHKPHPVNFIICEGPVGTGKTMTVNFFIDFAQRCDMHVASYACVSGDISVPLGVINKIIMTILGDDLDRLSWLASRMHWEDHDNDPLQFKTALLRRALGLSLNPRRRSVLKNFKENVSPENVSFMGHQSFNPENGDLLSMLEGKSPKGGGSFNADEYDVRDDDTPTHTGKRQMSNDDDHAAGARQNSETSGSFSDIANSGVTSFASGSDIAVEAFMTRLHAGGRVHPEVVVPELDADTAAKYKDEVEADDTSTLPTHSDNEGILFHLLFVLLNENMFAIVIDNAQNCDESSWNVLLMVSHLLANAVVMLALRAFHVGDQKLGNSTSGDGVSACVSNTRGLNDDDNSMHISIGRNLSLKPTLAKGLSGVTASNADGTAKHNPLAWSDFHGSMPASCAQLLSNPYTVHLELKPFTLEEVRVYMYKTLESAELVRDLPEELVVSVHEVSSGCPFWVQQIVTFINTRGEEIFLSTTNEKEVSPKAAAPTPHGFSKALSGNFSVRTILGTGSSRAGEVPKAASGGSHPPTPNTLVSKHKKSPLHQMIVVRLESMTPEEQTVLKSASIIGEEFNAALLEAVLPQAMKAHLAASLEALVQAALIFPGDDESDLYSFANPLIHEIIYGLTPPSEANKLHKSIAHQIEVLYLDAAKKSADPRALAACYRLLILHYSQHMASRPKTFKYLVLMCDECVHNHAYSDVATYADRACGIANSRTELRVLLVVLDCVLHALNAKSPAKLLFFASKDSSVVSSINQVIKNVKVKIAAIDAAKGIKSPITSDDEKSKSMSIVTKKERSLSVSGGSISLRRDASKRLDWADEFTAKEGAQSKGIVARVASACTIS